MLHNNENRPKKRGKTRGKEEVNPLYQKIDIKEKLQPVTTL